MNHKYPEHDVYNFYANVKLLKWIPLDEHVVTPASGAAYDVSEHSQDYRTGYAEALQAVLDRIRVSGKQDLAGWVDQQLKTWKP